jgi:nitrogen fixation/metabolism regulation signal transduction histidine kinase
VSKFVHSLRFQLPTVVLGVFLGMLFLLMLFFHEMGKILVQTRQLAESAEISDMVATWNNEITVGARERTKLMSLGKESYLRSFQVSLNESNDAYARMGVLTLDTAARSSRELRAIHQKHLEYMELLDHFAKEQAVRRLALAAEAARPPPPAPKAKPAQSKAKAKKGKASRAAKARKGVRAARGPRGKTARAAQAAVVPAKPPEPPKEVALDSATNETFRAYEAEIRDRLNRVQDILRSERKEKLGSLRNSVGRAKDRLIYSLLLLLAMVGYVAVILKWKILDPMKLLKQGAMEIVRGSLGHQVSVNSRNEMGELAEVFNRMSVQLEQKQAAEVRLKRLEAIEQIVRSVNHEINNPLMIISGNAEYLLAILQSADEDVRNKLGTIVGESRRIFTVTQRLKEIKEPVTESYIGDQDQMIDLIRSSQIRPRDY